MAGTAQPPGDHADADDADSVLAEREEAALARGPDVTAPAAAARVDAAVPATSTSDLFPAIQRLKQEQARLRADKKRVAKELKNAEKRRSRLKRRAKQLSDGDLIAVLETRALEKERAKADLAAAGPPPLDAAAAPKTPPS